MSLPTDISQYDQLMNCLEVTQRNMEFVEMYHDFMKWPKQRLLDREGMKAIEHRVEETIYIFNDVVRRIGGIPVRVMMNPDQLIDGQVTSIMGFTHGNWVLELQKHGEKTSDMLFSDTANLRLHHEASFSRSNEIVS